MDGDERRKFRLVMAPARLIPEITISVAFGAARPIDMVKTWPCRYSSLGFLCAGRKGKSGDKSSLVVSFVAAKYKVDGLIRLRSG